MFRTLTAAALLCGVFTLPAQAQTAPQTASWAGGHWAFNLGAVTDARSKDISKSNGDPSVHGLAEWSNASGLFYVAPAFETIDNDAGSDVELAATAGVRPQFAGFDLDLNVASKWQVDSAPGFDDQAWEFTANISRSIGPAKARLQIQHSPDGLGATEAWTWVEARVGWDFTDKLSGTAAVGRREQDKSVDYTGWNAGMTYALTRNLDLDVRYFDTDAEGQAERRYGSTVVAGLNVYF